MLFRYSLPKGIEPLYPTIADAYASTIWPYHFLPSASDEHHGWTLPWDEPPGQPCPEVVHKPISGEFLEAPITRLPGGE